MNRLYAKLNVIILICNKHASSHNDYCGTWNSRDVSQIEYRSMLSILTLYQYILYGMSILNSLSFTSSTILPSHIHSYQVMSVVGFVRGLLRLSSTLREEDPHTPGESVQIESGCEEMRWLSWLCVSMLCGFRHRACSGIVFGYNIL